MNTSDQKNKTCLPPTEDAHETLMRMSVQHQQRHRRSFHPNPPPISDWCLGDIPPVPGHTPHMPHKPRVGLSPLWVFHSPASQTATGCAMGRHGCPPSIWRSCHHHPQFLACKPPVSSCLYLVRTRAGGAGERIRAHTVATMYYLLPNFLAGRDGRHKRANGQWRSCGLPEERSSVQRWAGG